MAQWEWRQDNDMMEMVADGNGMMGMAVGRWRYDRNGDTM